MQEEHRLHVPAGRYPVPDHTTIARFISLHLSQCIKEIYTEQIRDLYDLGELSGTTVFIDGTKIEANANRYTFVWKKTVTKNMARMMEKIPMLLEEIEIEEMLGKKLLHSEEITIHTLKRVHLLYECVPGYGCG